MVTSRSTFFTSCAIQALSESTSNELKTAHRLPAGQAKSGAGAARLDGRGGTSGISDISALLVGFSGSVGPTELHHEQGGERQPDEKCRDGRERGIEFELDGFPNAFWQGRRTWTTEKQRQDDFVERGQEGER